MVPILRIRDSTKWSPFWVKIFCEKKLLFICSRPCPKQDDQVWDFFEQKQRGGDRKIKSGAHLTQRSNSKDRLFFFKCCRRAKVRKWKLLQISLIGEEIFFVFCFEQKTFLANLGGGPPQTKNVVGEQRSENKSFSKFHELGEKFFSFFVSSKKNFGAHLAQRTNSKDRHF